MNTAQETSDAAQKAAENGLECIWQLQDCYEAKDIAQFFSLISIDFKKDLKKFGQSLVTTVSECRQIKLYVLLRNRSINKDTDMHYYDVCWSRRTQNYTGNSIRKAFGRAEFALKEVKAGTGNRFLLYDIDGDNPFC